MQTSNRTATAFACSNIAFIKYWGNRDDALRLPLNGSVSMNLDGLHARTTVQFDASLQQDQFSFNSQSTTGPALERVARFLNIVREMAGERLFAQVTSENNFPTGAGIASSAAAFAALALAASRAIGLELPEPELSRLARRGSGSASRSVPGGFVEWTPGTTEADSIAFSIAPPDHWDLVDCVAVLQAGHKPVGSTHGHALAHTSPLQDSRVLHAPARLDACRTALLERDFSAFAQVVELDSNLMHAVMMTSTPPLFYWEPASLALIKAIPVWREEGWDVCYTLDAGPNVHVICRSEFAERVQARLASFPGVQQVLTALPGGPAHLV
jgi:diphosphomevalonate decarboxylase